MIKRIAFLFFGLLAFFNAAQAQRLVKLNLLEKSPLANMVVYSMNDSTANYTKLVAGTGIQITYNENDTTLTITATGTSVGVPQTLSLDDATRVLSISDGNSVDLSESIQEEINAMLVAGDNVTLTYNDVANTLTIASTGGGGGATNIGDLGDVTITSATTGQVLKYDGAAWINGVDLNTETLSALIDVDTTGKTDGSIVLYNSTSGNWEAQANSIDNLTDGYKFNGNIVLGRPFVRKPTSVDYANIYLGVNAGPDSLLGYANIAIGQDVFRSFIADPISQGNANIAIGTQAMNKTLTGFQNVAIGRDALKGNLTGSDNVALGRGAGYNNFGEPDNILTNYNQGLYIGTHATPKDTFSTNEVVIGYNTIGNGSNTATLGNNNITATYLKGTTNLRGYGLGNKEATDLTKTRSPYIAAFATDGTLLELDTTGLFGGGSGTPQTLTFSESTRELTISDGNTVDLSEGIQEEMNSTLVAGTGITITYDDGAGTLTVAAPAGSGNTDEQTLSINNSTAELSISNGNTVDLSEAIDNQVNTLFTDGTNILSTYDDISNTLTVRTTDALTQIDAISFDNNVTDAVTSRLQYNADVGTFVAGMANNVPIKIGQDIGFYVKNNTASTIPKGTAVMAVGADGNSGIMLIDEMVFDGSQDAKYFIGVTAEAITSGSNGFVISQGVLKGFDTSLISPGSVLYGDPATPGGFVTTEPTGTNLKLPIANTLSQTNNGTIAIRVHTGLYMKDIHDVDITGVTNNSILKYNSTGGYWDIATDLVDDADADPTNEIQDLSLSGNTLSLSADATTVDLSPYLDEATTASNGLTLSGTDVKLGGTLSDATTTIDMNNNALTFTNNGGYNLSGTGGLSFTNTSATDYSSVLSIASTNTRIYADGGTTEPLNSLNLTSTRSGVKELDLRSSISNDNTTYTMIALNPTRFSMKTPNVTDLTATNGQFLKLVDRLTGEVEFATALTAEVDGSVTNEGSLSVTAGTGTTSVINSNTSGSAAVTLEASTGLSIGEVGNTITLTNTAPDQTVSLTGAGITAISGTYPNFTVTSTEVDGSVTNEIQDLSLTGNVLSLSGDATTVDLSPYLDESTTASNGLTLSGTNVKLGGALSETTVITINNNNLNIGAYGTDITSIKLQESTGDIFTQGEFYFKNSSGFNYGTGNSQAGSFGVTQSPYIAGFATNGAFIEVPISSLGSGTITASNGLTLSGSDVKLGGTLSETTAIYTDGNTFGVLDATTGTSILVDPTSDLVTMSGEVKMITYGSGNAGADDLGETLSPYKAAFADDGTIVEYDDIDAMVVACSDETTDITTGTAKVTFRAPHAMTITGVRASLTTASSSGNPTVDINEGGTSILGTKLTIDANEKTSTTAATAATITDTAIADDAEITIDIDAAGTGATGLKVTILYRKN